jgi:DNA-binding transcriptional LysR family regulator
MDQLESMRMFVKVADLGSFARAAGVMDISTATATRRVAALEERLGTRLLHRTTRKLSLTEAGLVYFERARQILDKLQDAEQMIVARNLQPMGTLRLVAPVVFGLSNLTSILQSYTESYPNVLLDVSLVDRRVDLVDEGFDVGIVIREMTSSESLVTRRLATSCVIACATPAYLEKHGTPMRPEHLHDHACLSLPTTYQGEERVFSSADGQVRVRHRKVIIANNAEMLRQCALLNMGIAILPSYQIGTDLKQGKLVRVLHGYRLPKIDLNVCYPSRRHLSSKARTFIDHLLTVIRHGSGDGWLF